MWWASRRARAAILAGAGLLLAACGFQPMYGESRGDATRAELQAVRIGLIPNRAGQELRRYILDRTQNGGREAPALYQLEVSLTEQRQFFGIQVDQTATYSRFVLTGYYTLRDLKTNQVVFSGNTSAYSSYNIANDPFNTIVAESDARDRAVRSLGDDLIARVALYLRNPAPPAVPKSG